MWSRLGEQTLGGHKQSLVCSRTHPSWVALHGTLFILSGGISPLISSSILGTYWPVVQYNNRVLSCSVTKSCLIPCDPLDCSTPDFSVLHYLPEFAPFHAHWVSDAIQPSHPLLPTSPPTFHLSKHQGLFQCVDSLYQVAKVLEFQHQCFQWIFRLDFL